MATASSDASDTLLAPALSGSQITDNLAGTTSAARKALFGVITAPKGWVYMTFANISTVRGYIAFKLGTAAASVTTTTGWPIEPGEKLSFWIDFNASNDVEYIMESSTGNLRWYISSPPFGGVTGLGR